MLIQCLMHWTTYQYIREMHDVNTDLDLEVFMTFPWLLLAPNLYSYLKRKKKYFECEENKFKHSTMVNKNKHSILFSQLFSSFFCYMKEHGRPLSLWKGKDRNFTSSTHKWYLKTKSTKYWYVWTPCWLTLMLFFCSLTPKQHEKSTSGVDPLRHQLSQWQWICWSNLLSHPITVY